MTAFTTPTTFSAAAVLTAAQMNTNVRDNINYLFENIHSGSSTAGWASYTPTWTGITVGNGTSTGKKGYAGKTTFGYAQLTFGSSTSVTAASYLNFPDTAVTYLAGHPVGQVALVDTGTAYINGMVHWDTTARMHIFVEATGGAYNANADISSTVPFTWVTGDLLIVRFMYERA